MSPQEFERKLTAILSADLVCYSRLISDDDATVRRLTHKGKFPTHHSYHQGGGDFI